VAGLLVLLPWLAPAQSPTSTSWKFSNVDTKLLEEVNEVDRQFQKKGMVFQDPEVTAYVRNVADRLIGERESPELVKYQIYVLRDTMVNAFAMPNGSIYVNTGLLAALENEAQFASVLSHEISHVERRHTYQHNRSLRKKAVAIHVFEGVAAAGGYFPAGSVFGAALSIAGAVSQVLVAASVFGYSQDLEREADMMGFIFLDNARYNTAAMARTFEILDERLEVEPVEPFWRTHPKLQERITTAKKLQSSHGPDGLLITEEKDYTLKVAPAIRYNIRADLSSRRARTALARAQRLLRFDPDNPANRVLVADAYRTLGAKTAEPKSDELTRRGQAEHRQHTFKLTAEEEQKELLSHGDGVAVRQENQAQAKTLYLEVIEKNVTFADAYRGMGMLYEDTGENDKAVAAYKLYLELAAPDAQDRLRIERRLERLNRGPLNPSPGSGA
jgi:tetratricopeptide (TPR) repeat protein